MSHIYIYIYNDEFNKFRRLAFNIYKLVILETILLQLNSSTKYYTSGDHDIIFIKIDSKNILMLYHTYFINRNTFHNYTINENIIHDYEL